jgi:ribose-phosphate pyrophosphokinase
MIKVNGAAVRPGNFPDGTLLLKFDKDQWNVNTLPRVKYEWVYEDDSELFTLICLRKHLAQFKNHELWLPYIPHARMDRTKSGEDVFTLKYFCEIINSLNFDKVYVRDPHSSVSMALLDRAVCEDMNYWFDDLLDRVDVGGNLVLFYPDEGAMKRYSESIKGYPYAFGVKKRNWETGKIESLALVHGEAVKGKRVLIIDDICSYGGTFLNAARALREAGAAEVYLYVTHLESNVLKGDMYSSGLVDKIYTTPSITWQVPADVEDIEVL